MSIRPQDVARSCRWLLLIAALLIVAAVTLATIQLSPAIATGKF